jgi:histidinol dehydrogenase
MTDVARSASLPVFVAGTAAFDDALARLAGRGESDFAKVEGSVRTILEDVRREGDDAVFRYVERYEKRRPLRLCVRQLDGAAALSRLGAPERVALELAAARITTFHERERDTMFAGAGFRLEAEGRSVGLRVRPLERVGIYAPGGKARYPSSVLMSAIPAKVAGVRTILVATPLVGNAADDAVLAAAHLGGVSAIVDAGGAQAIAALAYGTQSVARVDKIVGPGNAFVACAKRLVYGTVAIDSIAGPSEILVLADRTADPVHVAADLLSQAEHDEEAYPLLVTTDRAVASAVNDELVRQLAELPRVRTASESILRHGHALVVPDRAALVATANVLAAEHLSLQVASPEELLAEGGITRFGACFVGGSTPEAVGDYIAGPSHVLPTGGAVRFGSPLGVHDFVARSSVIRYQPDALARDAAAVMAFARLEGLEGHARAVALRVERAPADRPRR